MNAGAYRDGYYDGLAEAESAQFDEGWRQFEAGSPRPIGRSRKAGWEAAQAQAEEAE